MMKKACQRAEEQVSHRQKVAGPDLLGMGVHERLPGLAMWSCGVHSSHVLLDSALADVDAEALSNSPRMRSAPHSRLSLAIS